MTSWKKFFFLHFVLVLVELLFGCRERTCWSMNAYWFFVHYSFKSMRKQFLFNKPTKQENKILFKYDKNTEGDGKNQFSFAISNRVKDVHQILNTQQKELQFYRSRFTFSSLPFWNFSKSLRVYRRRWGDAINRTPAYANGNKCFTDAKRKMFILLPTCHCLTLATAILAILKWKMKNEWRKEQFANGIAIDIRRNFINLAAASRFVRVLFFSCCFRFGDHSDHIWRYNLVYLYGWILSHTVCFCVLCIMNDLQYVYIGQCIEHVRLWSKWEMKEFNYLQHFSLYVQQFDLLLAIPAIPIEWISMHESKILYKKLCCK